MAKFLFAGQKVPKSLLRYNLYRGVTDFGTLEQFNIFQSGNSFFKILGYPKFLSKLATKSTEYRHLIENALHVIEFEYKGINGIEDMSTNTQEISDGVNSINVINSVKKQSASTISLRYMEKSGSLLTKFTELYLASVYDYRSTFKHYQGLIDDDEMDAGYENEVFTFLYWVTDSTGLSKNIEKAYMFIGAQPTSAPTSIYESVKGEHDGKEVTLEFTCFVADSPQITELAKSMHDSMVIIRNVADAEYSYKDQLNWEGSPQFKKAKSQ